MSSYVASIFEAPGRSDKERSNAAGDRHPGRPGRRRAVEAVAEVAGVEVLERNPGRESRDDGEDAEKAGEHRCASRHGVRERHETDEPPALGDRDGVREGWE